LGRRQQQPLPSTRPARARPSHNLFRAFENRERRTNQGDRARHPKQRSPMGEIDTSIRRAVGHQGVPWDDNRILVVLCSSASGTSRRNIEGGPRTSCDSTSKGPTKGQMGWKAGHGFQYAVPQQPHRIGLQRAIRQKYRHIPDRFANGSKGLPPHRGPGGHHRRIPPAAGSGGTSTSSPTCSRRVRKPGRHGPLDQADRLGREGDH